MFLTFEFRKTPTLSLTACCVVVLKMSFSLHILTFHYTEEEQKREKKRDTPLSMNSSLSNIKMSSYLEVYVVVNNLEIDEDENIFENILVQELDL